MSYADPHAHFIIERATIRMPYCPDTLVPESEHWPVVTFKSPVRLRRSAEQLARQFVRETRFDFPPFTADDETGGFVVLLPSRDRLIAHARLMAGAVGVSQYTEGWAVSWVYVHPYERSRGLVDDAWPFITARWPGIRFAGPFTPAGAALRDRLEGKTS